jgi:2-amino-4-hydroxy-6-hydroxymethyldihydropteridine diphosphokinase
MVIGSDAGKASGRFIFSGKPETGNYSNVHKLVYLSLGSNLGDPVANLNAAIAGLRALGDVVAVSSFYETEPVELTAQPWFSNCAIKLDTEKMPKQLMSGILDLEKEMGRRRQQNKGPRIIDIDILLFGSSIIETKGLTIPHPAMHQRRFVLEPLAEIAPEIRHPGFKRTVRELRDALPPGQQVRRIFKTEGP